MCPVYAAGEKIDKKYNPMTFAKSITQNSNTQVVLINGEKDLNNFLKKNLISDKYLFVWGPDQFLNG